METIEYSLPLIKQGTMECTQASATSFLQFYNVPISFEEVKKQVPVYITPEGKPLGTAVGHIASYFIQQGLKTTLHISDIELFDISWKNISNEDLIINLQKRSKYYKHSKYDKDAVSVIVDGYIQFLKAGGEILFPIIDKDYIISLLKQGPIYCALNYNLLHQTPKIKFENGEYKENSFEGDSTTHAVVIAGYKENAFLIVDPDAQRGGYLWINCSHIIAAFYLAQIDLDNYLITIKK